MEKTDPEDGETVCEHDGGRTAHSLGQALSMDLMSWQTIKDRTGMGPTGTSFKVVKGCGSVEKPSVRYVASQVYYHLR